MEESIGFPSDFGDSFFRGIPGRLALIFLGVSFGIVYIVLSLNLDEWQYQRLWTYARIFIGLTILFLVLRPARQCN